LILYLDTSALVKAYFNEAFTAMVLAKIKEAEAVASHVIAFVEAHATFARLQREGKIDNTQLISVKQDFINDWNNYLQVNTIPSLITRAADLAEGFALRAYDSVHLAAAENLQKSANKPIEFACFDHKLNQAAKILGMSVITE
jgi:predicted nucleic acid-binding protein